MQKPQKEKILLHPKAAPALYLNFAMLNLETLLKEIGATSVKKLENKELELLRQYYLRVLNAPEFLQWEVYTRTRSSEEAASEWATQGEAETLNIEAFEARYKNNPQIWQDGAPQPDFLQGHKSKDEEPLIIEGKGERQVVIAPSWNYARMREVLLLFKKYMDKLRNYYSHLYYHDSALKIREDEKISATEAEDFRHTMERLWQQAKWQLLNRRHQARASQTKLKYKVSEKILSHHDLREPKFQFFHFQPEKEFEDGKKKEAVYRFDKNQRAVIFLASFFLYEDQSNQLMSQARGFKNTGDTDAGGKIPREALKATRDLFHAFPLKRLSRFHTGEGDVRAFMRCLNHLSQIPRAFVPHLQKNTMGFRFGEAEKEKVESLLLKFREDMEQEPKSLQDLRFSKKDQKTLVRAVLGNDLQQKINEVKKRFEQKGKEAKSSPKLFEESLKEALGTADYEAYGDVFWKEAMGYYEIDSFKIQRLKNIYTKEKMDSWEEEFPEPRRASREEKQERNDAKKAQREVIKMEAEALDAFQTLSGKRYFRAGKFENDVKACLKGKMQKLRFKDFLKAHLEDTCFFRPRLRQRPEEQIESLLQFLDDFEVFGGKLRFQIYKNTGEVILKRVKKYHNGQTFEQKGKEILREYAPLTTEKYDEGFRYNVGKSSSPQIPFALKLSKKETAYGKFSRTELRDLCALLFLGEGTFEENAEKIIAKITALFTAFRTVYKTLKDGKSAEEAHQRFEKAGFPLSHLPRFLQREESEAHFAERIKKRRKLHQEELESLQERLAEAPDLLRKYDKIRHIIRFLNRFKSNPTNDPSIKKYLDRRQHEKMEVLLGTLPSSYTSGEFMSYFKEEDITLDCLGRNEKSVFEVAELDALYGRVLESEIRWVKAASEAELCQKLNLNRRQQGNLSEKALRNFSGAWNPRRPAQEGQEAAQTENYSSFYYLPKCFLETAFFGEKPRSEEKATAAFREAGYKNIGYRLQNYFEENKLKLPEFYTDFEEYDDKPELFKQFGYACEQQKHLDRLLLLMAQKYIGKITQGHGQAAQISFTQDLSQLLKNDSENPLEIILELPWYNKDGEKTDIHGRQVTDNTKGQAPSKDQVRLYITEKNVDAIKKFAEEELKTAEGLSKGKVYKKFEGDKKRVIVVNATLVRKDGKPLDPSASPLKEALSYATDAKGNVKMNTRYCKLQFALREWGKVARFVFDKRRRQIAEQYFEQDAKGRFGHCVSEIQNEAPTGEAAKALEPLLWVNREKLHSKKAAPSDTAPVEDIEDAYRRLELDQLRTVDLILKMERDGMAKHITRRMNNVTTLGFARCIVDYSGSNMLNPSDFKKFRQMNKDKKFGQEYSIRDRMTIPVANGNEIEIPLPEQEETLKISIKNPQRLLEAMSHYGAKHSPEALRQKVYGPNKSAEELAEIYLPYMEYGRVETALKEAELSETEQRIFQNGRVETAFAFRLGNKIAEEDVFRIIQHIRNKAQHNDLPIPLEEVCGRRVSNYAEAIDLLKRLLETKIGGKDNA